MATVTPAFRSGAARVQELLLAEGSARLPSERTDPSTEGHMGTRATVSEIVLDLHLGISGTFIYETYRVDNVHLRHKRALRLGAVTIVIFYYQAK